MRAVKYRSVVQMVPAREVEAISHGLSITDSLIYKLITQQSIEYEVLIETVNPCGGEAHANKEFLEIEAESPEAYVAQNARYPVLDAGKNSAGDTVITTGDGRGSIVRYTFTE